jgi:hypothetical protein
MPKNKRLYELQKEVLANVHRPVGMPERDYTARLSTLSKEIQEFDKIVNDETRSLYEIALNRDKPFRERVFAFIQAENRAGRKAKIVKDFILMFTPYGNRISAFSDFIRDSVLPQQHINMSMEEDMKVIDWLKDRLGEKSTTAGIIIIVGVLAYFGIHLDIVVIEEVLGAIIQGISVAVSGVVAIYEMIRKEKKDDE